MQINEENRKEIFAIEKSNKEAESKTSRYEDISSKDFKYSDNNSFDLGFSYKEYFKKEMMDLKKEFLVNENRDFIPQNKSNHQPTDEYNHKASNSFHHYNENTNFEINSNKLKQSNSSEVLPQVKNNKLKQSNQNIVLSSGFVSFKKKSLVQSNLKDSLPINHLAIKNQKRKKKYNINRSSVIEEEEKDYLNYQNNYQSENNNIFQGDNKQYNSILYSKHRERNHNDKPFHTLQKNNNLNNQFVKTLNLEPMYTVDKFLDKVDNIEDFNSSFNADNNDNHEKEFQDFELSNLTSKESDFLSYQRNQKQI